MTALRTETGRVYLIGAGPGDPKLLTLKAAEALAASDVVVYDYLVNPEVLAHTRRSAELIYAGKRAGEQSLSQAAINQLLIGHASRGSVVARLKGGDPFVFGRGGEEAEALVEAGIQWEVIPGISSGVAAAAYAGIPLTHRGYASSVAFITGHEADDKFSIGVDLRAAAHADTLVIFMCGSTIARIASELITIGRSPSTPIAIIRWGTYQHQEVYTGALEDIACNADSPVELKIKPPAIAIVGDVVSLQAKLHWFGDDSLRHSLSELPGSASVSPAPRSVLF
ncbi:MAG: uroporphyrinogen-III C-methyltransferase [Acidobacteriota bacterium]